MENDEIPFRTAAALAGFAYNTLKRWRHQDLMPFAVYERLIPGRTKPKLFCRVSEIEAWKRAVTTRVSAGS